MGFADRFINCFFSDSQVVSKSENDQHYNAIITASNYIPIDILQTQAAFNFLAAWDTLSFTITFGNSDPITLHSTIQDFDSFKSNLDSEYIHQQGEPISAHFVINKAPNGNKITIYELDTFVSFLESLNIEQALTVFNRILTRGNSVKFSVFNLVSGFSSKSLFFLPFESQEEIPENSTRLSQLENVLAVSNYTNSNIHRLTPDDFDIVPESGSEKLNHLFNLYSTVLSILYLFDITSLKGNTLHYKLNGYKTISGSVDVSIFNHNKYLEYYKTYEWAYTGGNLNDKVGLSRNIISLHLSGTDNLELKGEPLASIQSGFKVYEKQNIKQYIEIRNKISDQLLDFNNRANKVIETFANGFQKSGLALITFYFSAFAIKAFGKGDFINVFTLDTTVLSVVFIIGSLAYFFVARWEVREQRKRFKTSYENLKARYTDLLNADDIHKILNGDKEYNEDIKFITDKLKMYTCLWICLLTLLLTGTLFLFFIYGISLLHGSIVWFIIFGTS